MLTAADVEQKTFSTALRGYDLDEVDDFLDEVVASLRDLQEELDEAKSARATAVPTTPEPKPSPPVEEPPRPMADESAVGRALIAAQTAADNLLAEAETEASRILEGAKEQAESWETEKEARKAEAEAEMAAIAARVSAVRSELSALAEEVSGKLDDMDAVIVGEDGRESGQPVGDEIASDASDSPAGDTPLFDAPHRTETGPGETSTEADHLDEMLTGVATDLQLDSSDGEDSADGESASTSEEGEGDRYPGTDGSQ